MKRLGLSALMAVAAGVVFVTAGPLQAQTFVLRPQASLQAPSDVPAQRYVRRRGTPVIIYGRPLSPTAYRACTDWYAYEYRPSGTVIVPRMSCHWVDR
jgi:hypothetical protein